MARLLFQNPDVAIDAMLAIMTQMEAQLDAKGVRKDNPNAVEWFGIKPVGQGFLGILNQFVDPNQKKGAIDLQQLVTQGYDQDTVGILALALFKHYEGHQIVVSDSKEAIPGMGFHCDGIYLKEQGSIIEKAYRAEIEDMLSYGGIEKYPVIEKVNWFNRPEVQLGARIFAGAGKDPIANSVLMADAEVNAKNLPLISTRPELAPTPGEKTKYAEVKIFLQELAQGKKTALSGVMKNEQTAQNEEDAAVKLAIEMSLAEKNKKEEDWSWVEKHSTSQENAAGAEDAAFEADLGQALEISMNEIKTRDNVLRLDLSKEQQRMREKYPEPDDNLYADDTVGEEQALNEFKNPHIDHLRAAGNSRASNDNAVPKNDKDATQKQPPAGPRR